jgi:cellulose 1,4-beta-cellobiosidase
MLLAIRKLGEIKKAYSFAVCIGLGLMATHSTVSAATCSYVVENEWNTGLVANIRITNNTSTAINGWTVNWRYTTNSITNSWNTTLSGSNPYTATNLSWNASIPPGQTVSFGFQVDKRGGTAERPAVTGAVCSGTTTSASVTSDAITPSSRSSASNSFRSSSSRIVSSSSRSTSTPVTSTSRSSSSRSSVISGTRLDNPFVGAVWYINQDWAQNARNSGGAAIANVNTAVWMDRIGAIDPTDPNVLGLRDHLNAALDQGANTILVVIYDLPNRDCNALASNGELLIAQNGFNRYKNEYVNPIVNILSDVAFRNLRIIAIIEPDSLPNLVTNANVPKCQEAAGAGGYVEATQYTLNQLYPLTNVYSYIDIGHSGWLGWDNNFNGATQLIGNAIKGTTNGVNSVAGFITNTAGYTPLREPFLDSLAANGNIGGQPVRSAKFYEYNPYFSELAFAQAWRTRMISQGFPSSIGMLVDTSRNGWGGSGRPTAASTSTDLNTFVNASRVDRRFHRGNWCNQRGGIGERPRVAPEPGVDAYVWVKPPGESDGVGKAGVIDPTDPAKGFDRFCDPTFTTGSGTLTGAIPDAPHAGRWFEEGFRILLQNAYPSL